MGQWVMGHGSNGSTYLDGHMGHRSVSVTHWPTTESVKCEQPYQRLNYFICSFLNKTITSYKFNLLLKCSATARY